MGKLVRDNIPSIIIEKGGFPRTRILSKKEYSMALLDKLSEEVNEYIESGNIEELADIIEVIRAIAKNRGFKIENIEKLRKDKRTQRGGFEQMIYLEGLDE